MKSTKLFSKSRNPSQEFESFGIDGHGTTVEYTLNSVQTPKTKKVKERHNLDNLFSEPLKDKETIIDDNYDEESSEKGTHDQRKRKKNQ